MPVTMGGINANTSRVEGVEFGNESCWVEYRPHYLTPEKLAEYNAHTKNDETGDALVSMVESLVVQWDVLDLDGSMYPVTKETLNVLPLDFLGAVISACIEDAGKAPEPKEGSFSSG